MKPFIYSIVAAAALSLSVPSFAQDFEQGWAALQAGDYETVPWLAAIRSRDNFLVQVTGFQAERRASRRRPTAAG